MADRTEEIEIRLRLEALFQTYHFDFRGYALASLKQRLKRGRLTPHRALGGKALVPQHHRLTVDDRLILQHAANRPGRLSGIGRRSLRCGLQTLTRLPASRLGRGSRRA